MSEMHFSAERLKAFTAAVFEAAGLKSEDAAAVADNLVMADLRGVESHGTTRIPIYVERLERGVVKARPDIRIEQGASAVALVDGDNGQGVIVGNAAMGAAVALARQHGVGIAVARNSNHYGICSYYAMQALKADCIGISLSNAPRSMAVWGGREPALGTNPLGVAVPAGQVPPFVLDMATSVVARGKIVEKAKRGESMPFGWALDRDGNPTEDANAGVNGVVLPFGGAKGSGLAILVDILSGVLSGAHYGRHINNLYADFENPQNTGHFFMALDIAAFMPPDAFGRRMDGFVGELKGSALAPGITEILMPGEIERNLEAVRLREGIALPANVVSDIRAVGDRYGIALEEGMLTEPAPG